MRAMLVCILMDGGLPIEGREDHPFFDLDMAQECALMALKPEPDFDDMWREIQAYRARKTN